MNNHSICSSNSLGFRGKTFQNLFILKSKGRRPEAENDIVKAITCLYSKQRSSISVALLSVQGQVCDLTLSAEGRD